MPDIIDRLIREEQELEENKRTVVDDTDYDYDMSELTEEVELLTINND